MAHGRHNISLPCSYQMISTSLPHLVTKYVQFEITFVGGFSDQLHVCCDEYDLSLPPEI